MTAPNKMIRRLGERKIAVPGSLWNGQDRRDPDGKKRSEIGEVLSDLVVAAAESGEIGVLDHCLLWAASEAAVGLHVPDLGSDDPAALRALHLMEVLIMLPTAGREARPLVRFSVACQQPLRREARTQLVAHQSE